MEPFAADEDVVSFCVSWDVAVAERDWIRHVMAAETETTCFLSDLFFNTDCKSALMVEALESGR